MNIGAALQQEADGGQLARARSMLQQREPFALAAAWSGLGLGFGLGLGLG